MKATSLVKVLQQRIKEYDDLEVEVYVQTGPDSWRMVPITGVQLVTLPRNKRILEVQTE